MSSGVCGGREMAETRKTIIRADHSKEKPYVLILRAALQDNRLSFEARGLMAYLLSKPDNWEISPKELQDAGACGRERVYRILNELIKFGYLKRDKQPHVKEEGEAKGRFLPGNYTLIEEPCAGKPSTGKPYTENPQHTYKRSKQNREKEHAPDGDAPPKPEPVVAPSVADEASADPTPASGPQQNARDMVRDEVIEACRFAETARNEKETYGRAGQITRYLMGLAVKRGGASYQLAREDWRAQPGDFKRFAQWWRGKFPNADVPRSLDILSERWAEWREAEAQRMRLASVGPRTAALNAERALYGEQEVA